MKNKKIQILTNNDELVEQIRLDKNKKEQIIDYAVDRNHKYIKVMDLCLIGTA